MNRSPIVLTFGTFDLFHVGHLNIIERAAGFGRLFVGVSTDALNFSKKTSYPVYDQGSRLRIVKSIACVAGVFLEESLEEKRNYLLQYKADFLVMGDDWRGRFDEFEDVCSVIYLPRTPMISTSHAKEAVRSSSSVRAHLERLGQTA